MTKAEQAAKALRAFALSFPEAWEDFPWGDRCIKVRKKIFLFLGDDPGELALSVKLPDSSAVALGMDGTEPTGYGLGKAGWISARFPGKRKIPVELIEDWIDESYRAVAPKTLVKRLDA